MSLTAYNWALALHLFGVILWVGSMACLGLILSSEGAKQGTVIVDVAKKVARLMDVGALFALVCGVYMLVRTHGLGDAWVLKQPWMHIKLTVVALFVIGGHGFVEARLGKIRKGVGRSLPSVFAFIIVAAVFAIAVLAIVKPLAKVG